MHIAHLTPTYFSPDSIVGGGERYVHNLGRAIRVASSWRQTIIAMGRAEREFLQDGIPVRVLRNESPIDRPMAALSSRLWDVLAGFDLVHIHQILTIFGAYATSVVRSLAIPIVGTDLGGGDDPLMLRNRGLELASGVLSISRYAHDRIAAYYGGRHEVLIGPVDTDQFRPRDGSVRDPRLVLCVGRVLPHKGVDRVIAALPEGLRLMVVGHAYDAGYRKLLGQMARGKDVQFLEGVDDEGLLALYASAALLVQASTSRDVYGNSVGKPELMGLTTLEAMACGLPVAVARTGSLPELVPDPRFGRTFSSTDELAAILGDLASGAWPSAQAGAEARAHVVRHHGMPAIGRRLVAFYESLVGPGLRLRCAS
jgi:glycosyltransferase involved in cell wall biosynthesis